MNDETLERLMIDDAIGALQPDVSLLLAAYVTTLPQGENRLAAWRRVADAAQKAMTSDIVEIVPRLSRQRVRLRAPWYVMRAGLPVAAAMAAGVALGIWLSHRPEAVSPIAVLQSRTAIDSGGPLGVHDFWSSKRLVAVASQRTPHERARWQGKPSVSEPKVGGGR